MQQKRQRQKQQLQMQQQWQQQQQRRQHHKTKSNRVERIKGMDQTQREGRMLCECGDWD